jgi:DNA-binding PadR family transcriptional regulator
MAGAESTAGDVDTGLADALQCLMGFLGQVRGASRSMAGARGPGWRGGPWERGFTRPMGPPDWGRGFGGPPRAWWPGPPGPFRGPKVGRGDVRAAILALLREGPRNGYQIMAEIEERSGGVWRPSPGAVYPALQQLADEGLIEAEEPGGGRRTYRLTEEGRRRVEEDPTMARAAWESMTNDEPGELPGLFSQAARLASSIVQMAQAGTPEQVHAAEELLAQTRRRMYQLLAGSGSEQDDE